MQYIALGDSISIDEYPERETGRTGLGAASLFYRDLRRLHPGIAFVNLAADGATTDDVLRFQLQRIRNHSDESIVTLTAGGNDLLMQLRSPHPPVRLVEGIIERLQRIVAWLETNLAHKTILIGTVYDPSDGTNELYGERLDREARWLATVNDAIRVMTGVRVIDIHRHFLGHGITAPPGDRWYWSELIFEPNARGASEVRTLWLNALGLEK